MGDAYFSTILPFMTASFIAGLLLIAWFPSFNQRLFVFLGPIFDFIFSTSCFAEGQVTFGISYFFNLVSLGKLGPFTGFVFFKSFLGICTNPGVKRPVKTFQDVDRPVFFLYDLCFILITGFIFFRHFNLLARQSFGWPSLLDFLFPKSDRGWLEPHL